MKNLFLCLTLAICIFEKVHTPKMTLLSHLTESNKIDSLFDKIIPQIRTPSHFFSLTIIRSGDNYLFGIHQVKNKQKTILLNFMTPQNMKNFGYFNYKGYTIFVSGGVDPYNLFKRRSDQKYFLFSKENDFSTNMVDFFSYDYIYKDGKFSVVFTQLDTN